MLKIIDIPPFWLLAFALCALGLGEVAPVGTDLPALRAFGTGLVAGGCALILLATWEFRRHKTTIVPHLNASALITTGPFARSRNPIYLADAIILAGLCLRWDILPGLLLVPVFVWVIQTRFILAEEARLRAAFPDDFTQYAAQTRRWL